MSTPPSPCASDRQPDRLSDSRPGLSGPRSVADEPRAAVLWHPLLNPDLDPSLVPFDGETDAWWLCPVCAHAWRSSPLKMGRWRFQCPGECRTRRKAALGRAERLVEPPPRRFRGKSPAEAPSPLQMPPRRA